LLGDALIRARHLNGRILISALAATATTILFIPALFAHGTLTAVPYLCAAAFALSAQTAPLDAARLDIMPPQLWGRAESIRSILRSFAQALAPLLFGVISDDVFGGGRSGLQLTFAVMLLPLAASAALLYRALGTYPRDVATAAATASEQRQADTAARSS
jgi:MFS family permease